MKKIFILLALFVATLNGFAGNSNANRFKLYVGFINHFTKFIQWSDDKRSGDFVIGVYGDSPMFDELSAMLTGKQVNDQKIAIKKIDSEGAASSCHILFVSENQMKMLGSLHNKAKSSNFLIVADSDGAARKGADINFVEEGGSIKFELNPKNATEHGLKISGKLKELAKIID